MKIFMASAAASLLLLHPLPAMAQPSAPPTHPAQAPKLTRPPKLVQAVPAQDPSTEPREHVVSVLLQVHVAADGTVHDVSVIESGGEDFDRAAMEAVRQFVFEPAEMDGQPAAVRINYRYDFPPTVARPSTPATAELAGVVRDGKTHEPLPGVRVELDSGESAVTDARGRFALSGIAPGIHAVTLYGPSFTPIGTEEHLEAGKRYEASYDVDVAQVAAPKDEQSDFEIVISATKLDKQVAATEVSAEQSTRVAGTGGDVAKVVENLPGVARSTVGSGALVVWGAGAQDTRVYVDDVHVPVLYHEGGFRSVVHSDLVRSVELQPGGYGAGYGRGLGGLVTVGLRPLDDTAHHGSVTLDAIDAAASLRGPFRDDIHYAVGLRRSHLDWVLSKVTSDDVGEFVPIPRYWDGQARVAWTPRAGESIEAGGMISSDRLDRSIVDADPSQMRTESKRTGFQRAYARYRRETEDGIGTFTPFFGSDHAELVSRFGAVPAEFVADANVYGLRAVWRGRVAPWLALGVGVDAEVSVTDLRRKGSVTTPPREGDVRVFGQTPNDQVNADTWSTTIAGLASFVEMDGSWFNDKLHVIPGLRVGPSIVRASRVTPPDGDLPPIGTMREDTPVDRRIALKYAPDEWVSFKAAAGTYHQAPQAEDLSAVFGNPKLPPSRAVHYLAGASFRLSTPLSLELTSFYSRSHELAVRSPYPSPVRAQALVDTGEGRAFGTQMMLRHDPVGRFFGWASLSVIRSERTDADTGRWRPFDFDQTLVFNAVGSYDLGWGFEVGSRFRLSTGYPRTPVVGATYDSRVDAYQPIFGDHNAERIPTFYQIDVRAAKRFDLGGATSAELYLDVQNVTNHRNPEEVIYNFDYSKKSYITGLPILPVLGGKLAW
jgi:TonB family protein